MEQQQGLLQEFKQQDKLSINMISNEKNTLPAEDCGKYQQPGKLNYYYFFFVNKGSSTYRVDLEEVIVSDGQLLFVSPSQIITHPLADTAEEYYKVAFDENTLALLPQQFLFLINPLNKNIIKFNAGTIERVKAIFEILQNLLYHHNEPADTSILLAHLNSLLTELNGAYFESARHPASSKLSKYIEFKLAVETHLTEQNSVHAIAKQLATTTSSLYGVVKEFSGISPKEFITNRLMLEAQRKLRYSKPSVKELAYELGYNDPDYFSRLFKKFTGKSVSQFLDGMD